jgi:peptidoglycan/LPS O-acetylase OafA/YrhL
MRANHIALLKTLSLFCVILLHAMLPFTTPGRFWTFYADRQSMPADVCVFWAGFIVIPAFMLASGYLAALSEERRHRSVAEQVVNRAKRLLIPWFLLMVFWMAPLYALLDIPAYNRPAGFSLASTYRAGLTGLFTDHLWFLLVLFWVGLFWAVMQPAARRFGRFTAPALALAAALLMHAYGRGLTLYAIWETDGPLVWFALGSVLFRYRERIEKTIARHPAAWLAGNIAIFVVLAKIGPRSPLLYWATCCLGALAAFQICLRLSRSYETLRGLTLYRYFEDNAFRIYLFHMPGAYIVFRMLDASGMTAPLPFILLSFTLNFCITLALVRGINALEKLLPHAVKNH